jgi:hypothetical protein
MLRAGKMFRLVLLKSQLAKQDRQWRFPAGRSGT